MTARSPGRRRNARLTLAGIVAETLWVLGLGGLCAAICAAVFLLAARS